MGTNLSETTINVLSVARRLGKAGDGLLLVEE